MRERETFASRLGFILVAAGCAVGIGNVWKFPYICGQYGGAAFIVMYLIFLILLGFPIWYRNLLSAEEADTVWAELLKSSNPRVQNGTDLNG